MPVLHLSFSGLSLQLVADADDTLMPALQAALPPEVQCRSGTMDAEAPTLQVGRDAQGRPEVAGPHETRHPADTPEAVLHCVLQQVDQVFARASRQRLFVHAAVVAWRGRAIVMPGRSFTGKSTLVAALVRRGAVFYADDQAMFDEDGRVHAYRRAPDLREPAGQRAAHGLRLLRHQETAEPLPVWVVLATSFQAGAGWRPEVLRGARVALPLIDNTVLAREEHARTLQLAARVAEQAVLLQGVRGEADEVAARLLDMLDAAAASWALRPAGDGARLADTVAAVATRRLTASQPLPLPVSRGLWMVPHLVVPDALPPTLHQQLLDFALAHPEGFQESRVNGLQGARVDTGYRHSRTFLAEGFEPLWALLEPQLRAMLPAVRHALAMPWFRLGAIERQLTVHHDGGFFAPHADTGSAETRTRKISCVYYFHAPPQRYRGGHLRLFDLWVTPTGTTPAGTCTELVPQDNSLVFFRSDDHHEVTPVVCDGPGFDNGRFTVVIWFREAEPAVAATTDQAAITVTA